MKKELQMRDESYKGKKKKSFVTFITKNLELLAILGLTLISACIQIYFSLNTWGMITPEELCQSIELAHKMVFGYCYVCPELQTSYSFIPQLAKCRTPILSVLFVIPMYFSKILNLNYWRFTIPLIRIILGINGSLITSSTYLFMKQYSNGKQNYSFISAILVTFSPFLFFMAFRSVPNIFLIPWMFFILASYLKTIKNLQRNQSQKEEKHPFLSALKINDIDELKRYLKIILLTLFMGLIIYIRIDFLIVLGAILIFKFPYKKLKVIVSHIIGLSLSFLIGLFADSLYYGEFTISPVNWFLFNIIEGGSQIFGTEPFSFYFDLLFKIIPILIIICTTIFFFVFLCIEYIWKLIKHKKTQLDKIIILGGMIFASFFVILIFSIPQHKEFRFAYAGYLYFHLSIAIILAIIIERFIPAISSYSVILIKKLKFKSKKYLNRRNFEILYTLMVFSLIFVSSLVATLEGSKIVNWREGDEISRSLAFVGQQNDSTGVLVTNRFMRGNLITYLHKNIPLIMFTDVDFPSSGLNTLINLIKEANNVYNYVVLPTYQIEETPILLDVLTQNNFTIVHRIDTRASIFKHNKTS